MRKNVQRRTALAALVLVAGALFACVRQAPPSEAAVSAQAERDAFERQVAEYLRKFPYQATYDNTVRFTGGDPAKLNAWAVGAKPALVRAGQDVLPRTNNDTFIKGAALFLENGPVVLESRASSRARFSSIQLVDDRNVNYRNMVYPAGKYTLYFGAKPDAAEGEAIEVPSLLSIVMVRVEVRDKNDAQDVAAATEVFNGIGISGPLATHFPKVDMLRGYPREVAAEAERRMDEVFATVPFTKMVVGPGKERHRRLVPLSRRGNERRLGRPGAVAQRVRECAVRCSRRPDGRQPRRVRADDTRTPRRRVLVGDCVRHAERRLPASQQRRQVPHQRHARAAQRRRQRDVPVQAGV